ncbi:MAG TPA: prephenate dehydrogenase/arogenate dehydrogenase family protein [Thermoplasmata archaeon]|nr:prephenate dehydrogenase/arogenate dehydrogenase family protein [Thermoplasmata archaeon]
MEALRSEIDRIDSEIIRLVALRDDVAAELGLTKGKEKIELRDRKREKQVIEAFVRKARMMKVNTVFASILAELLISNALRVQNTRKDRYLKGTSALVIGGAGKTGEWICRFLSNRGAVVSIWDPRGRLEGYVSVKDPRKASRTADMVVVASPVGLCPEHLEMTLSSSPRGLVFDICSVKSHLASLLRRSAKKGVLVTSVHPMFGPGTASPAGRNLLVCDCGSKRANEMASRLFLASGANVVNLDLERHDELMAYVLGLPHLTSMLFAKTMQSSERSASEYKEVQGTSSDRLMRIARELSNESRRVYHDIQALNPETAEMISHMESGLRDLRKAALAKSPDKFADAMESIKRYLEVN